MTSSTVRVSGVRPDSAARWRVLRAVGVILRAAERRAAPWKNGGGLTREVAVHPAGSDLGNFDWRVSIAEVLRGGPFSSFPGVDRHMAVISGRLALAIADRGTLTISAESPPL